MRAAAADSAWHRPARSSAAALTTYQGTRLLEGAASMAMALLDRWPAVLAGVLGWAWAQPAVFSFYPASWPGQTALAFTMLAAGLAVPLEVSCSGGWVQVLETVQIEAAGSTYIFIWAAGQSGVDATCLPAF